MNNTLSVNQYPISFFLGITENDSYQEKLISTLIEASLYHRLADFVAKENLSGGAIAKVTPQTVQQNAALFTQNAILEICYASGFDCKDWAVTDNTAESPNYLTSISLYQIELGEANILANPVHYYIDIKQGEIDTRLSFIASLPVTGQPIDLDDPAVLAQVVCQYFAQNGYQLSESKAGCKLLVSKNTQALIPVEYQLKGYKCLTYTDDLFDYLQDDYFGADILKQPIAF